MHNDPPFTPSDAGCIEALEQRVAPAAVVTHWVGLSGTWTDPAHWDAGVPNNADGTGNSYTAIIDVGALNPVVTIDSHIVVTSLTNAEAIQVNANGSAQVGDAPFTPGALDNSAGSISVGTSGTFAVTNSVGSLTTAKLGAIHVGGGTFALQTALANSGATLSIDAPTGAWELDGGSIVGGTVQSGNGSKLVASPGGGTLDGVTLNADLDVTKGNTVFATIVHGLTLNGTATVGAFGFLNFDGTQTLGGTGSVLFTEGPASGLIQSNTADPAPILTIGSTMTIHGGATQSSGASIGDSDYLGTVGSGTIVNNGKISADVAGATLFLNRSAIVNHGTIEAKNGGHLNLGNLSTSNGTLSATGSGSMLEIYGLHWTNSGTLGETGAKLLLGGTFTVAELGPLTLSGSGEVLIAGVLQNAGTTLTLDPAAKWYLYGGTILGGTVQSSNGSKLVLVPSGGVLDGVTLNTDLDVTVGNSVTRAVVLHGLTLNGIATFGANSNLNFFGSQTLGGTGSVLFLDSANSSLRLANSHTTLTIGPGITIHGGSAQSLGARIGSTDFFGTPTDITVVNQGRILADVNGTSLNITGDRFINTGTLEEINGGTINAPTPVSTEKKILTKTSAPYAFQDADGTPVQVKWLGAGSATLVRFTDSNAHGDLFSITTNGSDLTSTLSISTTGAGATTNVETIDINGSLKALSAPTTNLVGHVSSTHSVGALTLGQVVSGSSIDLGPRAAGDTKSVTSLTFDLVANLQIDSATPLLALTAAQWLDRDGTPDVITAPSLGTLTIKAAASRALASDFEAGFNLTGVGVAPKALTLGHAAISGKIAGSDWKVTGNVGTITAGSTATDWSTHFTGSLLSFTTTGNASGDLHLGARAAGDLTSRTTLNFDTASELSIHSLTPILSLTTRNWIDEDASVDVIQAPSLGTLSVKGDTKPTRMLPGNFSADLTLNGAGVAATAKTLGTVTVKGKIDAATWSVTGAAGTITAGSTGTAWDATFTKAVTSVTASSLSGKLHAASIGTVRADNITQLTLGLTQTVSPTIKALGTLTVKNAIDNSDIRTAGNIGSVTAAKILHSKLFAGVQSGVNALPQTTADFAALATIVKVVVTGTANLADPGLLDSDIAASIITSASITRFAPSNNGVPYGLTADRIATLTLKTASSTVTKTNLNTPSADASGSADDFFVRIV